MQIAARLSILVGVIGALAVLVVNGEHADAGVASRWAAHLADAEAALAEGDLPRARRAWHIAHAGALRAGRWDALVAVGNVALRLGDQPWPGSSARAAARRVYRAALFRARADRSLDGVLRAGAAFAALGDREVVELALRIAAELRPIDGEVTESLRAQVAPAGR